MICASAQIPDHIHQQLDCFSWFLEMLSNVIPKQSIISSARREIFAFMELYEHI